jgi:hypothetical protein
MKLPLEVKDILLGPLFIGLKVFKVSLNLSKEREFFGLVNTVIVSKSCKSNTVIYSLWKCLPQ